jgi:hypothetical protein
MRIKMQRTGLEAIWLCRRAVQPGEGEEEEGAGQAEGRLHQHPRL